MALTEAVCEVCGQPISRTVRGHPRVKYCLDCSQQSVRLAKWRERAEAAERELERWKAEARLAAVTAAARAHLTAIARFRDRARLLPGETLENSIDRHNAMWDEVIEARVALENILASEAKT